MTASLILHNYIANEKLYFEQTISAVQVDNARLDEFTIIRRIGAGSFGTVALITHGKKRLAMKILEKQHIVKLKQVRHVITECHLLRALRSPFIVSLLFKFKDNANVFLCLEFVAGGEVSISKLKIRSREDLSSSRNFVLNSFSIRISLLKTH